MVSSMSLVKVTSGGDAGGVSASPKRVYTILTVFVMHNATTREDCVVDVWKRDGRKMMVVKEFTDYLSTKEGRMG